MQEFNDQLVEAYDGLETRFMDVGLDVEGVARACLSFDGLETGEQNPIPYSRFEPVPYPPSAVRLLVVYTKLNESLAAELWKFISRIHWLLPEGEGPGSTG
jgi:hypothetical protein